MKSYKETEQKKNEDLISGEYFKEHPLQKKVFAGEPLFNKDEGGVEWKYKDRKTGEYKSRSEPHILKKFQNNLYPTIRRSVIKYFRDNQIPWHRGRAHTTSSQVACVNHLYPIATDKEAVKIIINGLGYDFQEVLPLKDRFFINFEVKGPVGYINENDGQPTQIDAVIIARKDSLNTLIVIEWKYTESCGNTDKSTEKGEDGDNGKTKGQVRMDRYNEMLGNSDYLKNVPDGLESSVYYLEPFYQLMRQTLWASEFKGKELDGYEIDDYLHIHVVPDGNEAMLEKKYSIADNHKIVRGEKGGSLKETWLNTLTLAGQKRYKLVSPEELFRSLAENSQACGVYSDLIEYLRLRYW